MKKWICLTFIMFLICISATAFASPETITAEDKGAATDLIVCNNAAESGTTTFETNYVMAGSGRQDVVVTMYLWNEAESQYKKVYLTKDGNLVAAEWQIGASGLFIQEITLNEGKNMIALRAEKEGQYQVVKFEIVRINEDFFAAVKEINVDLSEIFDAIVGGQ